MSRWLSKPHRTGRAVVAVTVGVGLVVLGTTATGAGEVDEVATEVPTFEHVSTFDVTRNGSSVAEIVEISGDGRTLVYTDSDEGTVGFVDITRRQDPRPSGTLAVGGEPTSVAIANGYWALVAVNTSVDFVDTSGKLLVVNIARQAVVAEIPLVGQPDAVAVSPDNRYAAVAIENERDEDLNDGLIPQRPAGNLTIVDLVGGPMTWTTRIVDLTGLAETAPDDPEPEFVDINRNNQAVVTLQENNHVVLVDLVVGKVFDHFAAGSVVLENVDDTEEELGPQGNGLISFDETITRRREPDAVTWMGNRNLATANEGDYEDENGDEGGSRGFTVFDRESDGNQPNVVHEAGTSFEYASAMAGHYNEARSANKGGEPEAVEFGRFFGTPVLFVASERANIIGVYDVSDPADPVLLQMLPTGIGPEGVKASGRFRLLAVSAETSEGDVPSMITLYKARRAGQATEPLYPALESVSTENGTPIPWVAMSGLAGDPDDAATLYGVSDSILADGFVYTIDVSSTPALITDRIRVTDPTDEEFHPDLEGVAVAPEGGFWLASEGRIGDRLNALIKTDAAGTVEAIVELPAALVAGATSSGFEGVAVTEFDGVTEYVYAVVQREWADDAAGVVKIGRYDVAGDTWMFVDYVKAEPATGWVGLSEITLLPDGTFAIVERDNQLGTNAVTKKLYRVDLAAADFQPYGSERSTVPKVLLADLVDELEANSVWTPDKLEGFAVAADGQAYAVTDNDGLDDAIGQTVFLRLGSWMEIG